MGSLASHCLLRWCAVLGSTRNALKARRVLQATVVWVYSLWRQPPAPGTGCMTNQLNALSGRIANGMQAYPQAVHSGTPVCPSTSSAGRRLLSGVSR